MSNWHDNVFFGIHYDLHAGEKDTELGAALTHEHLRERLQQVKPDWIQCDCKGHPGYTSWPTEVGSTSPGVVKDALRIHRDVTRELGIKLGMHYSGVIDIRATEQHPEWLQINADGQPNTRGATCRLNGYLHELMIPQLVEIVETYDVDGFWIDGDNWGSQPCWCERCKSAFTEETGIEEIPRSGDDAHWDKWLAFQRQNFVDYVTAYTNAIHERKPECAVCSNWMYTLRQPEPMEAPVDYLSGDYTPDWGAGRAAIEARMLDQRGITWDLMAWGFSRTAGPSEGAGLWQMKNATHLCQEVAEVVALGGAIMVYTKPERSGWLPGWHHGILTEVGQFCQARKDVCFGTETVPQAAVLHPASSYYAANDPLFNYGNCIQAIEGALCALLESHRSTDILTEERALERMDEYRLVVVPERERLSNELLDRLHAYAHAGGHIVMSGAHLSSKCAGLVAADSSDAAPLESVCLAAGNGAVGLTGPWQAVIPHDGTEVLAYDLRSQEPDSGDPERPLITRRRVGAGTVTAAHGRLFRSYFLRRYPLMRQLIGDLVSQLPIEWAIEVDASPRLEVILRRKDGRLMVNLLNRGAGETFSPNRVMIDDLPSIENVRLEVRLEEKPSSVSLVPAGTPLEWAFEDGWCSLTIPRVDIHEIVAVE